jgi:hypothetical protein
VAVALLGTGALPGTAAAAGNLPPDRPAAADLSTNGRACAPNAAPSYTGSLPVVSATLRDPDADARLSGQFEAWWQDASGQEQRRTFQTDTWPGQSHEFQWRLPDDVPAQTPVAWRVRASDGSAWSQWSAGTTGSACRFVYDNESPEAPTITSTDFPQDGTWHDGVGIHTSFRAISTSPDVVSYRYRFMTGATDTVPADGKGGPLTVPYLAEVSGVDSLTVQAVDRAGRYSAPTEYQFRVKSAREPVARWKLADPVGSTSAAAAAGPVARAGTGVAFGAPGVVGTDLASTVSLDGSRDGFLSPDASVVRAGTTFAVSAWVRPQRLDRTMTAVSQDSGAGALFALQLRPAAGSSQWSFTVGATRIVGGSAALGRWTHLTGIYDAFDSTARLYVDGQQVGTAQQVRPPKASGALQLGREKGTAARWQGGLGDVRLHDRVLPRGEVVGEAKRKPVSNGNWPLESAPGGSSPELGGGQPLTLGGDATVSTTDPVNESGHLELSGTNGYAATARPAVDSGDSYTVAARVRLPEPVASGTPMTVLSQGGPHRDAFKVRYVPETAHWQLVVTEADRAGAREWVASQHATLEAGTGRGDHLAVVYDRVAGEFRLYVNGELAEGSTVSVPLSWQGTGGLQVGRARAGDGWGEYLKGSVDDVRAFSGALDRGEVGILAFGFGDPCFCR